MYGGSLVLIAAALYAIYDVAGIWFAVGSLAILVLLLWPKSLPRLDIAAVHAVAAALLGLLAVVGVNVAVSKVGEWLGGSGEWRLSILLGLLAAIGIFTVVAYWYLRRIGVGGWRGWVTAGMLAAAVIVVLPIVVAKSKDEKGEVPEPAQVASQLDLLIVGDGSRHPDSAELPASRTLDQFDVTYSVGVAEGDGVRWTLVGATDAADAHRALAAGGGLPAAERVPVQRTGADAALLLLVDGTPPVNLEPATLPQVAGRRGEVAEWKRTAAAAAPRGTPIFALLQSNSRRRLDEWRRWERLEDAVPAQAQAQSVADTALQLAVGSATAQADLALAMAHRPVLLFDQRERFREPLAVGALFREGRVTLCDDRGLSTDCEDEPLLNPHGLVNGGTHLRLDLRPRDTRGDGGLPPESPVLRNAIYVHPVSVDRDDRHLLYLDYWWYLPGNPVDVGGGALCGAGLVIPGVTCQAHESDWEGLTVVVDRSRRVPEVKAVHYAQHDSVLRYPWDSLRERWQRPDVAALTQGIPDLAGRPLAFVARGTHASYPEPCGGDCRQAASGLGESDHRGTRGWPGNDTVACGSSVCLQMLPTRGNGEKPALWNAYTGQWGERNCRLTYYCDSGSPPTAPGNQERYEDPTRYDDEASPRGPRA